MSEAELFRREMSGVRQLGTGAPARIPNRNPFRVARDIVDPDAEALVELSDLVTGVGPFDITNTTEYVEGAVVGLDPRIVRRLRAGEYACQRTPRPARHDRRRCQGRRGSIPRPAFRRGYRCVLIVHGRGLNSEGPIRCSRSASSTWLSHGARARLGLAFTSARPCDGGAGAMYVLLRRQRRPKEDLRVTEGSKS